MGIGEETGKIRVIDVEKKREFGKLRAHTGRIGTMDSYNCNLIASGSKDCNLLLWDIRSKDKIGKF